MKRKKEEKKSWSLMPIEWKFKVKKTIFFKSFWLLLKWHVIISVIKVVSTVNPWEMLLLQLQFFHVSDYKKDCEICLYPYHCSFHNSLLTQEHEDVNFSYFFLNCFLYRLYLIPRKKKKKKSMMEKELPTLTLDYNTKKLIYSKIPSMSVSDTPWTLFLSCMSVLTMLRWFFFIFSI